MPHHPSEIIRRLFPVLLALVCLSWVVACVAPPYEPPGGESSDTENSDTTDDASDTGSDDEASGDTEDDSEDDECGFGQELNADGECVPVASLTNVLPAILVTRQRTYVSRTLIR